MDTKLLFVRCFPKQKRCTDGTARTVYYLANITGDLEEVASSLLGHENSIVYEACADFREKYGHIFPVGSITVWDFVEAMLRWADKMIWFSFLIRSHENKWRCWFTKDISTKSWRDYTFLPDWDERFGNASNSSLWILLRIGSKIWPIHVIHNQFGHGWAGFWADNELRSGFKLVFGCERSWIFDVVVLMTHLEPLYFHSSTTAHEFQESSLMPFMIDDLGTPRHLRTSCFPSTMSTKENIMQFGYYCDLENACLRCLGNNFAIFSVMLMLMLMRYICTCEIDGGLSPG